MVNNPPALSGEDKFLFNRTEVKGIPSMVLRKLYIFNRSDEAPALLLITIRHTPVQLRLTSELRPMLRHIGTKKTA